MADGEEFMTLEEWASLKQRTLDELDVTWEQVLSWRRDCGCCFDTPAEFSHITDRKLNWIFTFFEETK